jgi:hypothetical protein
MIGLLVFVREHGEAIEADLLRWYGLDLFDLGRPRLSMRRFRNLIGRLPRDAELWREMHGDVMAWGPVEHLVADLVDVERLALWQRGGNSKAPRPQPIDRPGTSRRRKSELSGGEMKRRLIDLHRRDEARRRDDGS